MTPYSEAKTKRALSSEQGRKEEFPESSTKKMAVLFTDIVGSSKYFKSRGNLAGRKMLKRHQNMVSPVIEEYGGSVVKFLGDSVLAYFLNPEEALQSGIKIQQAFHQHNQGKEPKDQIRIRLCIHYGDGIVEDKDIFGDVVNTAAKLLALAGGDQIFISHEIYEHVRDLSFLLVEPVKTSDKKSILKDLTTYRVVWDETIILDPPRKTLFYIRPVLKLGNDHFVNAWKRLIGKRNHLWGGKVENQAILSDKSIALILKESSSPLALAQSVANFIRMNMGSDSLPFLPIQIVIDSGSYLKAGKMDLNNFKVNWKEIKPGDIYISPSAYSLLKDEKNLPVPPLSVTDKTQSFYKITLNDQEEGKSHLFLYQNSMVHGRNPPCFYCGDRRHPAVNCPSKQLPEVTHGIERLGYLSLEELNNLFYHHLTTTGRSGGAESEGQERTGGRAEWAHDGFFELKKAIQIRLLKAIWNGQIERWNQIREAKERGDKGGLIWIGQDCIRVSNMDRAETIIRNALERDPHDYKTHCAMGFLHVERQESYQAEESFENALSNAKTQPQKIFGLFILSRLHDLNGNLEKAKAHLRKIVYLDPYCTEATYQDILFKFREGNQSSALHNLTRLIEHEREYFVNALIDPELADYSDLIHPVLKNLLNKARKEAEEILPGAEKELTKLKDVLGEEEKAVKDAQSLWLKVEELSKTDSFFSYLDLIYYGSCIIRMGRRNISQLRMNILKVLNGLKPRTEEYINFIRHFPYPYFLGSTSRRLELIQSKMDNYSDIVRTHASEEFRATYAKSKELVDELDQIGLEVKRLNKIQQVIHYSAGFLKKSLIFQSANLIIAVMLFPMIAHYLNFLMPDFKITTQNIWLYQKGVIILGGILGLVLAFFMTTKSLIRK